MNGDVKSSPAWESAKLTSAPSKTENFSRTATNPGLKEIILIPLQATLQPSPSLISHYLFSLRRISGHGDGDGWGAGEAEGPNFENQPLEAATNPFPNLGLVSMGQDVDVWLQGAGFDDHLVPAVGWVGTQLISLARGGPGHLQRVITFQADMPRRSNGFNGPPDGCKQTPRELEKS